MAFFYLYARYVYPIQEVHYSDTARRVLRRARRNSRAAVENHGGEQQQGSQGNQGCYGEVAGAGPGEVDGAIALALRLDHDKAQAVGGDRPGLTADGGLPAGEPGDLHRHEIAGMQVGADAGSGAAP